MAKAAANAKVTKTTTTRKSKTTSTPSTDMPRSTKAATKKGTRGDGGKKKKGMPQQAT